MQYFILLNASAVCYSVYKNNASSLSTPRWWMFVFFHVLFILECCSEAWGVWIFKWWLFTWTGPGVTLHDFVVPLFSVLKETSCWSPSCLIPIWNPQIRVGWCRTSPCSRVHLLFAFFFMMPILSLGKSHLIRALICSPSTISNRDVELLSYAFIVFFFKVHSIDFWDWLFEHRPVLNSFSITCPRTFLEGMCPYSPTGFESLHFQEAANFKYCYRKCPQGRSISACPTWLPRQTVCSC